MTDDGDPIGVEPPRCCLASTDLTLDEQVVAEQTFGAGSLYGQVDVICRMQVGHPGPHHGLGHGGYDPQQLGSLWLSWDDTGRVLDRRGDCPAESPVPGRLPLECMLASGHPGGHSYDLAEFIAERRRADAQLLAARAEPIRLSLENLLLRMTLTQLVAAGDELLAQHGQMQPQGEGHGSTEQKLAALCAQVDRFANAVDKARSALQP